MPATAVSRCRADSTSLTTRRTPFRWRRCGWHGYRSDSRYLVFQALPHTLGLLAGVWRVLAKAHELRNIAEYEGHFEADATLLRNLIEAAEAVRNAVMALPALSKT